MSIRKGSSIIAGNGGSGSGSAMNVDNITTQLNSNDEIQTIGVIEKNNSSPKYDWVGTYNEWILGRSTGTINDSWICYITDDDGNVTSSKERTLGEIIFSLIPQSDPALHLLDGSLIDGTGVYNAFYTYMKNLYDNGYDKCFTDETSWQSSVTTYGVCGKFVLDTSNQTIRLPMIEGFVEGTLDEDALGELVEAGLPNITGSMNFDYGNNGSSGPYSGGISGSFSGSNIKNGRPTNYDSNPAYGTVQFNASHSSSIYGNSTTVQPQSIKGFYYIVLSTSVALDVPLDVNAVVNDVTNLQTEIGGADYVVEYQNPTSTNNYTWYRLYKSGWIEQGGWNTQSVTSAYESTVTLPKQMSNANYVVLVTPLSSIDNDGGEIICENRTATTFRIRISELSGTSGTKGYMWEVKGISTSGS